MCNWLSVKLVDLNVGCKGVLVTGGWFNLTGVVSFSVTRGG